jgi:hypothetical protein
MFSMISLLLEYARFSQQAHSLFLLFLLLHTLDFRFDPLLQKGSNAFQFLLRYGTFVLSKCRQRERVQIQLHVRHLREGVHILFGRGFMRNKCHDNSPSSADLVTLCCFAHAISTFGNDLQRSIGPLRHRIPSDWIHEELLPRHIFDIDELFA